jgi:hypothetical protein
MVDSADVVLTERKFSIVVDVEEKEYMIVRPNYLVGNKADLIYKKGFTDAIDIGLMTTFQMSEKLEDIEYYNKNSEQQKKIDEDIATNEALLDTFETEDEATPTILKLKELRARRLLASFKINSMYENTAESYAETVRNQFYASELTRTLDGDKVWKNFNAFKEDISNELAQTSVTQVMLFNARLKNNYEMDYPEQQWMLKHGLIDDEGNWIKKEDEEEPEKGVEDSEEVAVEKPKSKPAKPRKKKAKKEKVTGDLKKTSYKE